MEEVRLDPRDMKSKPCSRCEDIIQETVGGRGDDSELMTWGDFALSLYEEDDTPNDTETDMGNP